MKTVVRYGQATAIHPGKHGHGDWRVEFNGVAPTHAEVAFMLGMILLSEDRYPGSSGPSRYWRGRFYLWQYLDDLRLLLDTKTPERVVALAADIDGDVARSKPERVA